MCAPYGSDLRSVARCCQPVVHGRTDAPSLNGRFTGPLMAGDEKQNPLAMSDRELETAVNCTPGRVEVHSVEIENAIGLHRAAPELLVPASVERAFTDRPRLLLLLSRARGKRCFKSWAFACFSWFFSRLKSDLLT
jgi:hypothetical protein